MLEPVLHILFAAAAAYLLAGLLLLWPIHARWLAHIDPACANARIVFRLLISPGLVTFWPLILYRRRRAAAGGETAGPLTSPLGPLGLRRWHAVSSVVLVLLGPLVMIGALSGRGGTGRASTVPEAIAASRPVARLTASYGKVFPSTPARVYLAQTGREGMGLIFKFEGRGQSRPTALYWSESLAPASGLPADAVFMGMVSGPYTAWIPFSRPEMRRAGYWIAYSFLTHTTEVFDVRNRT